MSQAYLSFAASLQPYKERPPADASVAKRMVNRALGNPKQEADPSVEDWVRNISPVRPQHSIYVALCTQGVQHRPMWQTGVHLCKEFGFTHGVAFNNIQFIYFPLKLVKQTPYYIMESHEVYSVPSTLALSHRLFVLLGKDCNYPLNPCVSWATFLGLYKCLDEAET